MTPPSGILSSTIRNSGQIGQNNISEGFHGFWDNSEAEQNTRVDITMGKREFESILPTFDISLKASIGRT